MKKNIIMVLILCIVPISLFARKRVGYVFAPQQYSIIPTSTTHAEPNDSIYKQENNSIEFESSKEYSPDFYYVVYLLKTGAFDNTYKDEIVTKYGESNLRKCLLEMNSEDLLTLSNGHNKDLSKYRKSRWNIE